MNSKSVNLVLPGLFQSIQQSEIDLNESCTNRIIQRYISKSNYCSNKDYQSLVIPQDYRNKLPLASYESNMSVESGKTVLYADPIYIELKSDHIIAYPLSIQDSEHKIERLIEAFNEYFIPDELILRQLDSGRIICEMPKQIVPNMSPSVSVYGRDVKHFLPKGEGYKFWIRIFNEVQMFLHEFIKEEDRQFGGQLLNGFWFWGAGNGTQVIDTDDVCIGDSEWVSGFCKMNGIMHCQLFDIDKIDQERFQIIDESLLHASSIGDYSLWLDELEKLEDKLLKPLNSLLKSGVINNLTIQCADGSYHEYKNIHRFRFYKKTIPIQNICTIKL